jgi:PAS domain S-box-containing protein
MVATGMTPIHLQPSVETNHAASWWRAGVGGLVLLVFWLDLHTPSGLAVPMFYVVPTLLLMWAGRPWEPFIVAAVATLLTAVHGQVSPPGDGLAMLNRVLEVVGVWMAAAVAGLYRILFARWSRRAESDRAEVERSLRRLEEMRSALDQAAIVAITDHRGVLTYVNDKFCEISKYSRDELLGQDHRIINSRYHPKEFMRDLWRTIARGEVWRGEIRNRAKDGSIYWVDTTIVPFLDRHGHPRQYLAIRSDITQRKVAEARLREQAALTHLGQLAAVVAHEVRNPLAGVRGTLQVLASRLPADMRERDVISTMIDRIDALNAKVTDLLVYARPTAPKLQAVQIRTLIADAGASARAATGLAPASLEISGDAAVARADPDMLRPVLLNLLLNAYQASGNAPVEVGISRQNGACTVAIMDRGPGIPPDVRERIFEPFYTTKPGGTGLGLPVVKRLMELQGGAVRLIEREGGGTAAELTLPVG